MKTTSEIKFKLKDILPAPIFKTIYLIWSKSIKYIHIHIKDYKSLKFKNPIFKHVAHEGINFEILIDPKNGCVDKEIFVTGKWEPHFLSIIKENLKEGGVFVDIGANIGHHSLFASRVVGDSGKVISFEPQVKIFNQFQKSIEKNNFKNIVVHNKGCGDKEMSASVYSNNDNIGGASVYFSEEKENNEKIDIIIPDKILETESRINFIKIDTEGYELEVLRGLKNTIKKYRPIIYLEYSPSLYKMIDKNKGKEIISLLKDQEYHIYDVENYKVIDLKDFDYYEKNKIGWTNFICK